MKGELTFRSGRTLPIRAQSSGSETLLRIRSLAACTIGTRESSIRKRQVDEPLRLDGLAAIWCTRRCRRRSIFSKRSAGSHSRSRAKSRTRSRALSRRSRRRGRASSRCHPPSSGATRSKRQGRSRRAHGSHRRAAPILSFAAHVAHAIDNRAFKCASRPN